MRLSPAAAAAEKVKQKLEADYIKNVTEAYTKAYAEMRREVEAVAAKYARGEALTRTEIYTSSRFKTLMKSIERELASIKAISGQTLSTYLTDQYMTAYYMTAYGISQELGMSLVFGKLDTSMIQNAILSPMTKIALTSNKTVVLDKIRQAITIGIARGEGTYQLGERIRQALEQNANNAVRIAKTETTRISSHAKHDSMERAAELGIKTQKMWVATLDNKTRDSHADLDGEIVDMDEDFSNGLAFPGDDSGEPEEVCNCRCTYETIIAEEGDKEGGRWARDEGGEGKGEEIDWTDYETWKDMQ